MGPILKGGCGVFFLFYSRKRTPMNSAKIVLRYDKPRAHKELTGDHKIAGLSLGFLIRYSHSSIKGRCGTLKPFL